MQEDLDICGDIFLSMLLAQVSLDPVDLLIRELALFEGVDELVIKRGLDRFLAHGTGEKRTLFKHLGERFASWA